MPRSTRSPATVSAPRAVSLPATSRCACWRRCSGRSSGPTAAPSRARRAGRRSPSSTERAQQDHRDDDVGDDRAGEPGGHVEGAADVRGRRWWPPSHHLAGGQATADRHARPARCAGRAAAWRGTTRCSQLSTATRCRRTPNTACDRCQAEARPVTSGAAASRSFVGDARLQAAADRGGHQRLGDHPDHAEGHRRRGGCATAAARSRAGTGLVSGGPGCPGRRAGGGA